MKLEAYEKYKDSGIEVLEKIPAHWEVRRVKDLVKQIIDTEHKTVPFHFDGKYLVVRTSNIRDGKLVMQKAKFTDFEGYRKWTRRGKPKANDIILTREAPAGEAWVVSERTQLCLGQRTVLLKPKLSKIHSQIIVFNIYCEVTQRFIDLHSNGSTVLHLNMGDIPNIPIIAPLDIEEQEHIAIYLDRQTTLIDQKVNLLQQKIDKYQELKKSLINETVCWGLNKNVPVKDSGVEWIGDIPAHWDIRRLKDVSQLKFSNVDKKTYENQEAVLLCNYVDVYKNDFIDDSIHFMKSTANNNEIKRFQLKVDDVLATKDSESFNDIANPALVKISKKNLLCGYHLAMIRTRKEQLLGAYLFRLLQSEKFNYGFSIVAKGITRVGLSITSFNDAIVFLPPLKEQYHIINYLDHKAQKIDAIIANIQQQIEKLKELRETLINDIVTGKLKVPNA